jgi:hypothetical protein
MWQWFGGLKPARQALVVIGVFVALIVVGSILGSVTGGSSKNDFALSDTGGQATQRGGDTTTQARPTYHFINDGDGFQCRTDKADKHSLCPQNPDYGKTAAQLHAEAVAARAAARARARARAAAIRAANAWHAGYALAPLDESGASGPVYLRWENGLNCQDFATDGCWHAEVIARDGCPNYVGIQGNEYQAGKIVGEVLDNNGNGIPAKTPVSFELDADQPNVTLNDVTVSCS